MEPACLIMSLLCKFLDAGFIRIKIYLALGAFISLHFNIG
jgi:hypothetical protein